MRRILCGAVLVWLVMAWPAVAQQPPDVNNPSGISFTASADHQALDSYELDILRPDLTVLQTLNVGKPTPDASQTCIAPINVQPVAFGVGYSMQIRAKAATAVSANVPSVNKFNRVPGAPSKLIAKEPEPLLEANW